MHNFTPQNYTPAGPAENITDDHREFWLNLPTQFLYHELGVHLWAKQADIIRAIRRHRRVAVRSCNGSGKTFAAACAVIWWLMAHPTGIAVTTAPTPLTLLQISDTIRTYVLVSARSSDCLEQANSQLERTKT